MADVQWIKLSIDMFNNRKIKFLRNRPEGNNIILIWVMLLSMAGRCNAGGMIFLTENVPYTTKMLAEELNFKEDVILIALKLLEQLGMIQYYDEKLLITGWEEHQNIEGLEKIREQARLRQAKLRNKQKLQLDNNVTCNVTVTHGNAIEEELEIEEEIEIELEEKRERIDYQQVVDMYNNTCVSFPRCKSLSDARKKSIKARLNTYSITDLQLAFEKVEKSDFLKGKNDRNWSANFDWILKDSNMAKIFDGNYDNKKGVNRDNEQAGRVSEQPRRIEDLTEEQRKEFGIDL